MARRPPLRADPPRAALFDVCVHGQAISAQTARRDLLSAWKQQVKAACADRWRGTPIAGNVRLRVTYYCDATRIDTDNLVKPVQDALQGIVYANDRQVLEGEGRRRNINDPLKVRYISAALAMAFSDGRPFVHIEVWDNPDLERVH